MEITERNGTGLVPVQSALLRPIATPTQVIEVHKEAVKLIEAALEQDRDYGIIPGTERPTLLKPGAERLLASFGIYAESTIAEQEIDHDRSNVYSFKKWVFAKKKPSDDEAEEMKAAGTGRWKKTDSGWSWQTATVEAGTSIGLYRYVIKTDLKLRTTGMIVGTGIGSCSSLESKYLRSPRDSENTILKMAKKRSLIDATLSTLGLSDRFTQDVEDIRENVAPEPEAPPAPPKKKANMSDDVRKWLEGIALTADELKGCKTIAKEVGVEFADLATETHGEQVETKEQFLAYFTEVRDAHRKKEAEAQPEKTAEPEQPIAEAEVVEAEVVGEEKPDPYAEDSAEEPEPAKTTVIEGQVVNTETGEVKGEAATAPEKEGDPFFNGEYDLTPEQRRKIITIVRGSGITLEDVLNVGKTEKASTIEELIKIAEKEAAGAK